MARRALRTIVATKKENKKVAKFFFAQKFNWSWLAAAGVGFAEVAVSPPGLDPVGPLGPPPQLSWTQYPVPTWATPAH